MRSLDRFYEYLEKQERAKQGGDEQEQEGPKAPKSVKGSAAVAEKKAPKKPPLPRPAELPGAALPGFKYVLRGGVTVAVPTDEPGEPAEVPTPAVLPVPEPAPAPAETESRDAEEASVPGLLTDKRDYIPPLVEADEPPHVAEAPARPRGAGGLARRGAALASDAEAAATLEPVADLSEGDAAALWRRLPRHIQLLVGMSPEPAEEVAQKYYTRGFKETRQQLIERLLDPTLTLEDTARVLGVCPTTVRRYTNRGTLPCYRTVGQQRRFRLSDVLAFLEKQQHDEARQAAKGRKGGAVAAKRGRADEAGA